MGWIAQNHVGLDSSKHIVWFAHFFFAEKPSGLDSLQTKQENIFFYLCIPICLETMFCSWLLFVVWLNGMELI